MLIDNLMTFSHLGLSERHKRKVNLNTLVKGVLQGIREESQERKIRWKVDELPEVLGDQSLLRLVIVNLLSNSVKFTSTRQQAEITIGCKDEGDNITCSIADNGVGFNMEHADRLFGVFQLHTREEFEVRALALQMCSASYHAMAEKFGPKVLLDGAQHFTSHCQNRRRHDD